ncbi:Carbohydrate acetyl esterase/feruloyl esterase precursor [Vibrio aerogenes CECT 7868]|uniref:Carbohydrate acetyl esterase/feruloyl esterase n=1 Tax=Vibrio aerogenes CECT 7868 TaxID=1216006 RepID=A0A1M5VJS5_9VIBR|nr:sialate O-acetylesterase [Vibrio aerogenes]SHH75440.1 Carbohydrate acetyl esterase/feruloyl esterase precursor [Vibrio aerogenes CECT 7868]
MNKLPLLAGVLSMALLPVCTQAAPDPDFHIYLALGQSNMQGAAHLPETPISHPRVRVLQSQNCSDSAYAYGTWRGHFQPVTRCKEGNRQKPDGTYGPIGLSPVDTFAVTMAEAEGENVTIGIVGASYGGADIRAMLPNCADFNLCKPPYGDITGAPVVNGTTPMYPWILDLAKKAQKVGVIKGIIFHQGETNAGQETWVEYVRQFVTHLRKDLNLDPAEVPFIAGELPRTGCCATAHNPLVHRLPDAIENADWVSSGPMPDGTVLGDRSDHLHWSTFSVIEMGKRYAAKMLEAGDYPAGGTGSTGSGSTTGGGELSASLTIKDDWKTGYCADVNVTNQGQSSVAWQVALDIEGTVSNVYNAEWTQDGATLTLSGVDWNKTLKAGASVSSVGFCAKR